MKNYVEPTVEINLFELADVITTSNPGIGGDASSGGTGNDNPFDGN